MCSIKPVVLTFNDVSQIHFTTFHRFGRRKSEDLVNELTEVHHHHRSSRQRLLRPVQPQIVHACGVRWCGPRPALLRFEKPQAAPECFQGPQEGCFVLQVCGQAPFRSVWFYT